MADSVPVLLVSTSLRRKLPAHDIVPEVARRITQHSSVYRSGAPTDALSAQSTYRDVPGAPCRIGRRSIAGLGVRRKPARAATTAQRSH